MKTADQALTEWTMDEILFDYCDGRGPLVHNRDQFVKVCEEFEIYDPARFRDPEEDKETLGTTGPFIIGSGSVRSGQIGQMHHISTGFMSTGGVGHFGGATMSSEPPRDDISKLANWPVLNRIKQTAWLYADFLAPVMCKPNRDALSRVQSLLEPRNVAQFTSAKDLLLKLMELSIKHENAGTSTH